ncbi:respiratory nitrate reductase subunit gamma [Nocardia vinacea]|uniref:respiratory nitrate reductase subunit gamma n=1 Tax=Nocardia vinacea TaxID=96468 RepID=UPI002E1174D0|nr:respiratory nitrate reductase subunit gamma [Nocardia vinacea]
MTSLLWIALPYGAFVSFVLGHIWRYRRDGFRSYTSYPEMDRSQRFGSTAFRSGVCLIVLTRLINVITTEPHARPSGALHVVTMIVQIGGVAAAAVGAVLLFLPDLITGPSRPVITPLDRITFPALTAALLSGVIIEYDPTTVAREYRTGETLFAWFRSLVTIDPYPEAMQHAPLIYQARGLILLLILGIWPFTRLAGIFAGPVARLVLRPVPRRTRELDGATMEA